MTINNDNYKNIMYGFQYTVSAVIKTIQSNNLFDVLNRKHLYNKNPYRKPLSEKNLKSLTIIYKALEMFKILKISKNTKKNIPLYCFTWSVWSLNFESSFGTLRT